MMSAFLYRSLWSSWFSFGLLFSVAIAASWASAQSNLFTINGSHLGAELTNMRSDGELEFGSLGVSPTAIIRWSSDRRTEPGSSIALADGSWLSGQLRWPSERRVRLVSKWFEAVELEVDALRAIVLNASPSWPQTQQLQSQMLAVTGSQDVLFKRGSESASGIVTVQMRKSIDPASPDRASWLFKPQATVATTEIAQSDIAGIVFSPILRRVIPAGADSFRVNFSDGSQLLLKAIKRREDSRVECTLVSGQKLVSLDEVDQFVLSITQITGQPASVIWLSDIEPARYRLIESESRVPWPLGRNRDLSGKRLFDRQGQAIEHALVMHSPSQVAYRPDGRAHRLLATVELLSMPSGGSERPLSAAVRCQVLVGRNGQLVSVWKSDVLRTGQSPIAVDVDISDSQLVALLVDEADTGTLGDHVMWRDVRVLAR